MWPVFFFLLWFAMPSRCRPDKLPDVINIANDNSFVSRVCSWGAVVLRGRDAVQIEARRKLPFALPLFSLYDCCHSHTRDGERGTKGAHPFPPPAESGSGPRHPRCLSIRHIWHDSFSPPLLSPPHSPTPSPPLPPHLPPHSRQLYYEKYTVSIECPSDIFDLLASFRTVFNQPP